MLCLGRGLYYSVMLNTASVYWLLRNNTKISNWVSEWQNPLDGRNERHLQMVLAWTTLIMPITSEQYTVVGERELLFPNCKSMSTIIFLPWQKKVKWKDSGIWEPQSFRSIKEEVYEQWRSENPHPRIWLQYFCWLNINFKMRQEKIYSG